MKISVSLGDFYYWDEEFSVDSQLNYLELVKDLDLDGVELHFSEEEILKGEFVKFKDKLDNYFVTVHLPIFKESEDFYTKLKELQSLLNIQNFVIHADNYVNLEDIPEGLNLVVENSDKDKVGYQSFNDMLGFKHDFCVDINHLDETQSNIQEQIDLARGRTKEFHVSSLTNALYGENVDAKHYLITGSSFKLPSLRDDVVWVIEGVIPKDRLDLLEEEIRLLRKN